MTVPPNHPRILGHGIDLVPIGRVRSMLDRHGDRFTTRVFTPDERVYCDLGRRQRAERYAARLAAKEAVAKALGTGIADGIAWVEIGVTRLPSGRPGIALSGRAAERAAVKGITGWWLSLTHAGGLAVASVIAEGEPLVHSDR